MSHIFLATLGKRPEAITIALDLLCQRYPVESVAILHTEPRVSDIREALAALQIVFAQDYPAIHARFHEISGQDGAPVIDIDNQTSASAYFRGVFDVLNEYRQQGYTQHLLVSGGRKAMSVYATLAATMVFSPRDHVWTVLSPDEMVSSAGQFHIPAGMRERVHLVDMPFLPPRIAPGSTITDPQMLINRRKNMRADFLKHLTKSERQVAERLLQHPHATNDELARMLHKSERTVENQLNSVYAKLEPYFDILGSNKRIALLDLLRSEGN